jgi:hypothetical protein
VRVGAQELGGGRPGSSEDVEDGGFSLDDVGLLFDDIGEHVGPEHCGGGAICSGDA